MKHKTVISAAFITYCFLVIIIGCIWWATREPEKKAERFIGRYVCPSADACFHQDHSCYPERSIEVDIYYHSANEYIPLRLAD